MDREQFSIGKSSFDNTFVGYPEMRISNRGFLTLVPLSIIAFSFLFQYTSLFRSFRHWQARTRLQRNPKRL